MIDKFLQYIQYEKRYSTHTVEAYSNDLRSFREFLDTPEQKGVGFAEADALNLRDWVVEMAEAGLSARTINRRLSCLQSFYKYLERMGWAESNPLKLLHRPKTGRRLPKFVKEQSISDLFNNVAFPDGFEGCRDRMILETLYATGIRVSELTAITIHDINWGAGTIKVLGKRNKERLLPVPVQFLESLKNYLHLRSQTGAKDSSVFISEKGANLNRNLVYKIVNKYLSQVSTLDQKSPHVMRHTFATHMLNAGANLNAIKELLGHANLAATQIYTHTSLEKLKSVYKSAHRRA